MDVLTEDKVPNFVLDSIDGICTAIGSRSTSRQRANHRPSHLKVMHIPEEKRTTEEKNAHHDVWIRTQTLIMGYLPSIAYIAAFSAVIQRSIFTSHLSIHIHDFDHNEISIKVAVPIAIRNHPLAPSEHLCHISYQPRPCLGGERLREG